MPNSTPQPSTPPSVPEFDLLLIGGGLANGLIALATLARHPERSIAIVERTERLAGNHTWCLHPQDVPQEARTWLEPLLVHRWHGYDVRFPGLTRTLDGEYAAITSGRLAERVQAAIEASPGSRCMLARSAEQIGPHEVTLDDGSRLRGELVVDARGPEREGSEGRAGYQKFLGLELELSAPHGLTRPLLMDATVAQTDGFRFMYVLPLTETRALVEDTVFSRAPELDGDAARAAVLRYAEGLGRVADVVREERGVLPMTFKGAERVQPAPPLRAGYRGGFCHPATGYSVPAALRVACHIAAREPSCVLDADFERLCREHRSQARYAEHLNWLLFHCFEARDMWNVFERFYRLPEPLIHRFYAMSMTRTDRARILMGKPPKGISLKAALAAGSAP